MIRGFKLRNVHPPPLLKATRLEQIADAAVGVGERQQQALDNRDFAVAQRDFV